MSDNSATDLPFNYVPTESICILFVSLFAVTTIIHIGQAIRFKLWYLLPTLAMCGVGETIGWSGRLWGSLSPFNGTPFLIQITTLVISPSFLTAAMFTLLPLIIERLGTHYSRLSPKLYKLLFIPCDILALVVQALGGGLAASASTTDGANLGAHIMLAGIVIQLVAVVLFTLCLLEILLRFNYNRPVRPSADEAEFSADAKQLSSRVSLVSPRWKDIDSRLLLMILGLVIALFFVLIRSVYRTIELSDGWSGPIISTQDLFNWFDGMPIAVAMFTFNIFHPGVLLRPVQKNSTGEAVSLQMSESA